MAIPYTRNPTWVDGSGGGTPITAAKLEVIEQGIHESHRMPCARVYQNAVTSLANANFTALAFNVERFDTDTIHDNTTNNSRLTCKSAGKYQIIGQGAYASNGTGIRQGKIRLNATTDIAKSPVVLASSDNSGWLQVATIYDLAVNDYVEFHLYQNSGAALNSLISGNDVTEFMMVRVA